MWEWNFSVFCNGHESSSTTNLDDKKNERLSECQSFPHVSSLSKHSCNRYTMMHYGHGFFHHHSLHFPGFSSDYFSSTAKDDASPDLPPKLFCRIPRIFPNQRELFLKDETFSKISRKYVEVRVEKHYETTDFLLKYFSFDV